MYTKDFVVFFTRISYYFLNILYIHVFICLQIVCFNHILHCVESSYNLKRKRNIIKCLAVGWAMATGCPVSAAVFMVRFVSQTLIYGINSISRVLFACVKCVLCAAPAVFVHISNVCLLYKECMIHVHSFSFRNAFWLSIMLKWICLQCLYCIIWIKKHEY